MNTNKEKSLCPPAYVSRGMAGGLHATVEEVQCAAEVVRDRKTNSVFELRAYDGSVQKPTGRTEPDVNNGSDALALRIASWNVNSLTGKVGELVETFDRRRIDFCCVQETRWKGDGKDFYGGLGRRYKLLSKGCKEGTAGVGIFVAERWTAHVVKVERISERMLLIKVTVGGKVINILSVYAPQAGRSEEEKDFFWEKLMDVLYVITKEEMVIVAGDLNGHVGNGAEGYVGVHGGFGYGQRNDEGNRILEMADALELMICNTMFMKEESKLVSYCSGNVKSTVDYILTRQSDKKKIIDAKVIPGEECVSGHRLLVVVFKINVLKKLKGDKFVPRLRVWKLTSQPFRDKYVEEVQQRASEIDTTLGLDEKWSRMKSIWLEAAEKVVGKTKGKPRHKETWWWDENVSAAVDEKRLAYKKWQKSKSVTDLEEYNMKKRMTKRVVAIAKQSKRKEIVADMKLEEHPSQIFKVAKQMVKERQDITGVNCLKDSEGKLVVSETGIKETWKQYMEKLMNEENMWDNDISAERKEAQAPRITQEEVASALSRMGKRKAPGLSGVTVEMMQAVNELSVEWLTDLCNSIIVEGKMPDDWRNSILIPLYKGKGDPLECGSYRGIKLLEHAMKVIERVLEKRIREQVNIDDMQFGFMPGKGTTDAIFIVRQVQEKYRAKDKKLYLAFVDLEKAFDRVPREVMRWALRQLNVEEWLVSAVMVMYDGARTVVRTPCGDSESFSVKVGVHQGSVLSPLLFAVVMEAITRGSRIGLPWELLYADDLVLIADSMETLIAKVNTWKDCLEKKGMKVNIAKTKVMISGEEKTADVKCKCRYPCGVCGKGVGINSLKCTKCEHWVHRTCSGVKGSLAKVSGSFLCRKCNGIVKKNVDFGKEVDIGAGVTLEKVDQFCYLGDTFGVEGGAARAVDARIRSGWCRFNQLARFLMAKDISLVLRGKVYEACVRSCMLYGCEAWPLTRNEERRFVRNDSKMIRWLNGVKLRDRVSGAELRSRLKLYDMETELRNRRLRWYGHVLRKPDDDWVKLCMELEVPGKKPVGRPKKMYLETVQSDMRAVGLKKDDALDRNRWKAGIKGRGIFGGGVQVQVKANPGCPGK